jgi:hypothetical protein
VRQFRAAQIVNGEPEYPELGGKNERGKHLYDGLDRTGASHLTTRL